MAIASYEFYTATYHGKAIVSADFDRLITRAESYIDRIAVVALDKSSEAVKMAACAVAEVWQTNEQGGELTAQSVGSWSQTYGKQPKSDGARLYNAVVLYIPEAVLKVRWC